MKKIILLLLIIFLTGCQSTYEIKINKDNIEEDIKIYTENSLVKNASQSTIDAFVETLDDWENGYDYYKRELYTTDEYTGYEYTYTFTHEEFDAMSQLRKCYKDFEFNYNDNTISLNTSKDFLCGTYYNKVDNIEITIKTDYSIVSSNADKIDKNELTWIINKQNYKNKPISFKINTANENKTNEKESKINIKNIIIVILFIVLVIIFIKRKQKSKRN